MSDRALDRFLESGLLDLKGNDEWYKHITATADALSASLRANPKDIIPFSYAALLPSIEHDDPAIDRTRSLLKAEWRTYASVSMASPTAMLRAIILDALLKNADEDLRTRSTLALLFASALPHSSIGREAPVWKEAVDQLLQAVEREAETAWSVPSAVSVPPFPDMETPSITVSLKARPVDKKALERGMFAAAGPEDENGESTEGNQHWPNEGHPWSYEFAPRAATAIGKAISQAGAARTATANTRQLTLALTSAVTTYLESFLDQIASTARGLEMRSRLLWWKEALVSPSAQVSYRDVDRNAAPGLMAYDYQAALPSLAPVSVSAFLREAIRELLPDEESFTVLDWIRSLAADQHAGALRETVRATTFPHGRVPLVSLVAMAQPTAAVIEQRTVFAPSTQLTASEFGLLTFLELQTIKSANEIIPAPDDQHSGQQRHTDQGTDT